MAFRGRDPVRTKIVIDNKIIEQVNSFNYLGNMKSNEKELDIDNKLKKKKKTTGILNVFRPQKLLRKQELCASSWRSTTRLDHGSFLCYPPPYGTHKLFR
jgi:hypothetical protein